MFDSMCTLVTYATIARIQSPVSEYLLDRQSSRSTSCCFYFALFASLAKVYLSKSVRALFFLRAGRKIFKKQEIRLGSTLRMCNSTLEATISNGLIIKILPRSTWLGSGMTRVMSIVERASGMVDGGKQSVEAFAFVLEPCA